MVFALAATRCVSRKVVLKGRFHPRKRWFYSFLRLFFNAAPFVFLPLLDLFFVTLNGPFRRPLTTPAQRTHNPPNVGGSVFYPKLPFNDFGNPRECPDIEGKSIFVCAFCEDSLQESTRNMAF